MIQEVFQGLAGNLLKDLKCKQAVIRSSELEGNYRVLYQILLHTVETSEPISWGCHVEGRFKKREVVNLL